MKLVAVIVGNTRTGVGLFTDIEPEWTRAVVNESAGSAADVVAEAWEEIADDTQAAIVCASVNPGFSGPLLREIRDRTGEDVHVIGEDVIIPMAHTLDESAQTGQDRFLAALAAHRATQQACVVVDAGTAVTVDFVDGEGVFHGGAILPGLSMQLKSLHEHVSALPDVPPGAPKESVVFAKNTREAMLNGVYFGVRGAVRLLAERYALEFGAYPIVIATGGDAKLLFGEDELIDRVVDDLVLRGIAFACREALVPENADEPGDS